MNFKKLILDDIDKIKQYLSLTDSGICDLTPGTMVMWRNYYKTEICIENGILFTRFKDENGKIFYALPCSSDVKNAIRLCVEDANKADGAVYFSAIPEKYLDVFKELYPECQITEQSDFADYIYNSQDLIYLKGKKFSAQRNLISQFKRNYPDMSFSDINTVSKSELSEAFFSFSKTSGNETVEAENDTVSEAIEELETYGMFGGVLKAEGKIVGFSIGEIWNGVLFVHIEKADRNCKGAYQTLVNCFSEKFGADTEFINREEDMGDEGLRRAKRAYNPVFLNRKFVVEIH